MRKSKAPSIPATPYIEIRTVPKTGRIQGVPMIASHDVYWMHRFEGSAVPCMHPNCIFDLAGLPGDQRIYLPLRDPKSRLEFLLDLPASMHGPLVECHESYADLRNCSLRFERREPRKNSVILMRSWPLKECSPRLDFEYDVDTAIAAITAKAASFATAKIIRQNPELRGSIVKADRPLS